MELKSETSRYERHSLKMGLIATEENHKYGPTHTHSLSHSLAKQSCYLAPSPVLTDNSLLPVVVIYRLIRRGGEGDSRLTNYPLIFRQSTTLSEVVIEASSQPVDR